MFSTATEQVAHRWEKYSRTPMNEWAYARIEGRAQPAIISRFTDDDKIRYALEAWFSTYCPSCDEPLEAADALIHRWYVYSGQAGLNFVLLVELESANLTYWGIEMGYSSMHGRSYVQLLSHKEWDEICQMPV